MKASSPAVPKAIIARLRKICLALPEATEEPAWVGIRWCVAEKNFAHVLMVSGGWPPAYAKAAGSDGPLCVLTFRSDLAAFAPGSFARHPYFKPPWWPNILGMALGGKTDWIAVKAHLAASYRLRAPKRLSAGITAKK
jgi:hypothetical protein